MIRGSLRAESFLGGEMKVDPAASRGVFAPLAEALDISVEELADSVIQLAESNIVRAIQQVSTERGRDPRGYAIVPFGGAGPLHAARVAEELGDQGRRRCKAPRRRASSCPTMFTTGSAPGNCSSRTARWARYGRPSPRLRPRSTNTSNLGVEGEVLFDRALEMRYVGQAFEVTVPLTEAVARTVDTGCFRPFSERNTTAYSSSRNRRTIGGDCFPCRCGGAARRPQSR